MAVEEVSTPGDKPLAELHAVVRATPQGPRVEVAVPDDAGVLLSLLHASLEAFVQGQRRRMEEARRQSDPMREIEQLARLKNRFGVPNGPKMANEP